MNISSTYFLMIWYIVLILIFVSWIGYVYLNVTMSGANKNYRSYLLELKRQDQFEEWAKQHKGLVVFEKIFRYSWILFIPAFLVVLGTMKDIILVPRLIFLISNVFVFAFGPFGFISLLILSRLYKKVSDLQS